MAHTEAHGIYGRNACKIGTKISHERKTSDFYLQKSADKIFFFRGFAASREFLANGNVTT